MTAITKLQTTMVSALLADRLVDSGLQKDLFQRVLERQRGALLDGLVGVAGKFVDMQGSLIAQTVSVNRTLSLQDMLRSTKRKLVTNFDVLPTVPRGQDTKATIYFFSANRCLRDEGVENEYRFWGLRPADLDSLAAVNEANPGFADRHPNSTWWKDKTGWCYARFDVGHNVRRVLVGRSYDLQPSDMFYAGMLPA